MLELRENVYTGYYPPGEGTKICSQYNNLRMPFITRDRRVITTWATWEPVFLSNYFGRAGMMEEVTAVFVWVADPSMDEWLTPTEGAEFL